jgi:hypothetical protein
MKSRCENEQSKNEKTQCAFSTFIPDDMDENFTVSAKWFRVLRDRGHEGVLGCALAWLLWSLSGKLKCLDNRGGRER